MKRFKRSEMAQGVLLICIMLAVAGCRKNQNAQNQSTQSQNPQSQSAAPPVTNPDTGTAATPAPANASAPQPTPAAPASSSSAAAPAPPVSTAAPSPESTSQAAPTPTSPATNGEQASNNVPPQPAPVIVPARTTLQIRINQHIQVKHAHAGDRFDGTIVRPVIVDGATVIPEGSLARGEVVEAHRRGHFKGRSVLELTLVGLDVSGRHYRLDTSTLVRTKKGKGKRTAAFIGGGTGVGMLIGGVATGGVGLLIGGLSGAGAGTLGAAFTGNRDIDIPAESVMSFRLAQPIQLR
jgi:hypothetical protein